MSEPLETNLVELPEDNTSAPNALSSQIPDDPPEDDDSLDAAIDRALNKAERGEKPKAKEVVTEDDAPRSKEKPAKVDPNAEKPEPVKGKVAEEDGEQEEGEESEEDAPKPQTSKTAAPARFKPTAQAKWDTTDPEIQSEIHRAISELEQGHQKYKEAAQRDSELSEYHQEAARVGVTVKQALDNYTAIDKALHNDFVDGLSQLCSRFGHDVRDVAAHILGQDPTQVQNDQGRLVTQLRQQVTELQQQVGGINQNFQNQRVNDMQARVDEFASKHPHYDAVEPTIASLLKSDIIAASEPVARLAEAYEKACRMEGLDPSPLTPAPRAAQAQTLASQKPLNPNGLKSVKGAPAAVETATPRRKGAPPQSLDDALDYAMSRVRM